MPHYAVRLVCEARPAGTGAPALARDEQTLRVEAPSLWNAREQALARMTIQAAGRPVAAYDADGTLIQLPGSPAFKPGQYCIDGLEGTYEGFDQGESWNGWAVPYFPLSEARRIAGRYAAQPATVEGQQPLADFDEARGVIRLYDPTADEWDETAPTTVHGQPLYPVGARLWTWERT